MIDPGLSPPERQKRQNLGISVLLIVYNSFVGSVTIANRQIEWSQSTNFNRIQDSA